MKNMSRHLVQTKDYMFLYSDIFLSKLCGQDRML